MPVTSHAVCKTDLRDPRDVCSRIEKAVHEMIRKAKVTDPQLESYFTELTHHESIAAGYFSFFFHLKGQQRQLALHLDCDSDHQEEIGDGPKIICSVNMWGSYEEIITSVAHSLYDLGPVHVRMNDSSGGDQFRQITPEEHSTHSKKMSLKEMMNTKFA